MKNINFDNPYLLLLAIPIALAILIPFFIIRNKDNKNILWTISLITHMVIIVLVSLAVAGLSTISVLTRTTVYVVCDVSYSSERNLDEIDDYIEQIKDELPENSKLGVVCFGKDIVLLSSAGRRIRSVSEANVDDSATDIVGALNYTEGLFNDDSIKRIVLITDGNDTTNNTTGSIATTVERLADKGIKIDAIFLNNTLTEGETEIQLLEPSVQDSIYRGDSSEVKLVIQSSTKTDVKLQLFSRPYTEDGSGEFTEIVDPSVISTITVEAGLNPVKLPLPTDTAGKFEYKVSVSAEGDISAVNNTRTFTQNVIGEKKILLLSGKNSDIAYFESVYGNKAIISSYLVTTSGTRVPFTVEDLVQFDEIIISNLDIRNIRSVNAFVDTLDIVVSQYGKSLVTMGDLKIQTNSDDPIFKKFEELLPVNYGSTRLDGRLYTILLDVSSSMFMASKFDIAKQSAIQLISVLDDEDYLCLITFSGDIKVETPRKVKDCKEELVNYISSLTTEHGTDVALGLEEALKTIRALNLAENEIMIISDGFSFDSKVVATEVAKELVDEGAAISAINTYIPYEGSTGNSFLTAVTQQTGDGKDRVYEISRPSDVSGIVFGSLATEVTEAIITKDALAEIKRANDKIGTGFFSDLSYVSKFILSLEKYDAIAPITLTYKKDSGYLETVPLYAYRSHGNGKVSSFMSSFTDNWMKLWSQADKERLLSNIVSSNTPSVRTDNPFTVHLERTEYEAYIEIIPSIFDYTSSVELRYTYPNGRSIKRVIPFDVNKYSYTFQTPNAGIYKIDIAYSYGEEEYKKTFTDSVSFELAYLPEYNSFATFDRFKVYEFIRDNGSVTENGIPSLENDKDEISTYKVSFVIPLLISAISLFVADVLIRKLKFRKKNGTKKAKAKKQ